MSEVRYLEVILIFIVMSHLHESPDKDQNSTHATGHLGLVEVLVLLSLEFDS